MAEPRRFGFGGLARRRRQPVLVMPGLSAGDRSTVALRTALRQRGHPAHGWGLGRNEGPTDAIIGGLQQRFLALVERHERPLGLVGWSMGGVYAWSLADRYPQHVRCVVTLGSPLRSTGVRPPSDTIPTTSIWTRWDGIVPVREATIADGPRRENIEVRATHLTLGIDPAVIAAVVDRVAQEPDRWQPFRPPWPLAAAFPAPRRPEEG